MLMVVATCRRQKWHVLGYLSGHERRQATVVVQEQEDQRQRGTSASPMSTLPRTRKRGSAF